MIGALVVIGLFAVLLWRGLRAGWRAPDHFGRFLGWGFVAVLVLQALVNVSVAIALVPDQGHPAAVPLLRRLVDGGLADRLRRAAQRLPTWRMSAPRRPRRARHALLAGGGSGGHVFPALAIGAELARRGWRVSFAGTADGMERRLVGRAGSPSRRCRRGRWSGAARSRAPRALGDRWRARRGRRARWSGARASTPWSAPAATPRRRRCSARGSPAGRRCWSSPTPRRAPPTAGSRASRRRPRVADEAPGASSPVRASSPACRSASSSSTSPPLAAGAPPGCSCSAAARARGA